LSIWLEDGTKLDKYFISNKAFLGLGFEDGAKIKQDLVSNASNKICLGLGLEDDVKIK